MLACAIVEAAVARTLYPANSKRCVRQTSLLYAAFTAAAIMADCLAGQPLMKLALFSFGQLKGIRFYGIGNEYMGTLVGVTLAVAFLTNSRQSADGSRQSAVGSRQDSGLNH